MDLSSFSLIPKNMPTPGVASYVKFTGRLDGRDKTLRLVQYFSRFLMYRLALQDPKSATAKQLKELYKNVGLHRKVFKLGCFIDEYYKFQQALEDTKLSENERIITLILRASMSAFLSLDNLVWLTSIKVIDMDKDGTKLKAYRLRLLAAFLNVALVVLSIGKTEKKVQKAKKGDDVKELEQVKLKQGMNLVKLVKNVADVFTYLNSAQIIATLFGKDLDDGTVGIIGSISSFAAMYEIWCTKV